MPQQQGLAMYCIVAPYITNILAWCPYFLPGCQICKKGKTPGKTFPTSPVSVGSSFHAEFQFQNFQSARCLSKVVLLHADSCLFPIV